jgi:hypothetical protein
MASNLDDLLENIDRQLLLKLLDALVTEQTDNSTLKTQLKES